MNLLDSITYAVIKTKLGMAGNISNDVYSFARDAYNRMYRRVWDDFPWQNEKLINISGTTSTGILWFPRTVDAIRSVRLADSSNVVTRTLNPISDIKVNEWNGNLFESGNTGTPTSYVMIADSPVSKDLTTELASGSVVKVNNKSTATSVTVRVEGTDSGGAFVSDEITAAAGANQDGTVTFYSFTQITKNQTDGDVQVTDDGDITDVWAQIAPGQTQSIYKRIQLVPRVAVSTEVKIVATRRFEQLFADRQEVMIPVVSDALIDLLAAELLEYTEDYEKAVAERQKGWMRVKKAVELERTKNQQDNVYSPRQGMFGDNEFGLLDTSPTGHWENAW